MTDLVNLGQLMSLTWVDPRLWWAWLTALLPPTTRTSPRPTSKNCPERRGAASARMSSAACVHGTFVAGILSAKRGSAAPAVCPDCTLLVNPVFSEAA